MKQKLLDALKHSTADYAEIRLETLEATALAYRGREMEHSTSSSYLGGIVRACTKGGWGVIGFDSLDSLPAKVKEACECAALVGKETTQLADVEPVDAEFHAALERDFRGVDLDDKLKLIKGYNDIILGAGPQIESSFVMYTDRFRTVYFASTSGSYFMEERPAAVCVYSATARDGSEVQQAFNSISSPITYDVVEGRDDDVRVIADRAQALLKAPKPEGGKQTVILNPLMAGVFIHEAFGHLSEADFLYENPQMKEMMTLGREVGPKNLNVIDDSIMPGMIGSVMCDDEGTPGQTTYLIRDGVLAGHLHSRETAAKIGEEPTGNCRAISREHAPIVRMTNTSIGNGDIPVDDLFAGVDTGIYACDAFGGQTQLEMFTFSASYGYRIENGEKGELLRDVVLTGNVFQTLKDIDGIANDQFFHQGGGGCGKGGQSPLPTTEGSPHVRVQNVVVGGR